MTRINYQRTYRGQSANQILAAAEISVMQAGTVEITHPEHESAIFHRDSDGDLVIETIDHRAVGLICGKRAAERLVALVAACDARQAALNKSNDKN